MKRLTIGLCLLTSLTTYAASSPIQVLSPHDVTVSIAKRGMTIPLIKGGHQIEISTLNGDVIETNCKYKYKFALKEVKLELEQIIEQAKHEEKMIAVDVRNPDCFKSIVITNLDLQ